MLREIKPMRLMWWINPVYWSVQGQAWKQAAANKESDVGKWFTWGPENCQGLPKCGGQPVSVPGVGCALGSWGSTGLKSGVKSGLAEFGSPTYSAYLADAMANSWTKNLGIDGYTVDCSGNDSCETNGQSALYNDIMGKVRETQPQVVMSGESYGSWEDVVSTNTQMGGQGNNDYHIALQKGVFEKDLSGLEEVVSATGADLSTLVCCKRSSSPSLPQTSLQEPSHPCLKEPPRRHPPAARWQAARRLPDSVLPRQDGDDPGPQPAQDVGGPHRGLGHRL